MGKRGLPPLRGYEVISILLAAGFALKSQTSARHDVYEHQGLHGQRRCVSVPRSYGEISNWVLQSIIKQSGMKKEEFYGMTEGTAKKIQCPFLKDGLLKAEGVEAKEQPST